MMPLLVARELLASRTPRGERRDGAHVAATVARHNRPFMVVLLRNVKW